MRTGLIAALTVVLTMQMPAWAGGLDTAQKQEVLQAFAQWRKALSGGQPQAIVDLYDKDALLLATLAAKPIVNQKERVAYFTRLAANPKLAATVNEEHVRLLDEDDAVVSGLYTFSFEQEGKTLQISARFSFIYKKMNGKWMIVEHHSSRVPEQS